MECNRDEAVRAKEIAEKKFRAKDFLGAKKFALKAQNLFPGLENISQMLATLDVYVSADKKVNGETDWYAILHVNPSANDETVKKMYRQLALALHPDKNKSIGADGAFKFVSEAWSVLSDKGRRLAYDQKRNFKGPQLKVHSNGACNFSNNDSSNMRPPKSAARVGPSASLHQSKSNTFWTSCHRCEMQYEYLRVYLNHNLLCPNCHEPFLAVEKGGIPANIFNPSSPWASQNSNHNSGNKSAHVSNMGPPDFPHHGTFPGSVFSRTSGIASTTAPPTASQHLYEKVRREREESQAAARREATLRRKNHVTKGTTRGVSRGNSNAVSGSTVLDQQNSIPKVDRPPKKKRVGEDDGKSYCGGDEIAGNGRNGVASVSGLKMPTINKYSNANMGALNSGLTRDVSQLELRNMLMEKARTEIRKKLKEWSSAEASKAVEKENGKETATVNRNAQDQNKSDESVDDKKQVNIEKVASPGISDVDSDKGVPEPLSINVPDPDFHDFDKDRSESSFEGNQVWAAYDDDDGMPRFYAMIQKVVSLDPFKMHISWLNSKTNIELGPLNWVGSGFTKTCGEFRTGKCVVNNTVNVFSHKVRWQKGLRGVIRIVPRKGDVWALYRNWSPDWNPFTPNEVIHKYDMVEVLDDYSEEHGLSVTPLVKVAGFKTVFHPHMDPGEIKRIPKEEMFRFSHQVPSWLLNGDEAQNAPRGCRELDPAATPLELLQIITEAMDREPVETAEQEVVS